MGPLAAMLSALVVTDVSVTVSRYKRNGAMWAIASLFFLTAYIFALVAGAIYLSGLYTPLKATIILAAISVVVGLIVIGVMYALNARSAHCRRKASPLASADHLCHCHRTDALSQTTVAGRRPRGRRWHRPRADA
ncbi:hypothetical protein LP421_26770 [Rhizobium sp. RCAM05350]|nr:hypothetical protein LP421_26770 [Rhizobium sp. RCAM05350]